MLRGQSPRARREGPAGGYLARVSLFGFGMTAVAAGLTIVVLPTRIADLAPEGSKNTYLGVLSFVGLLIAVAVQPIVGGLSDRARTRWGRRAPFIAAGGVASVPLIVAVGVAPSYALLFVFICALQITANAGLGPYQGLVRDLVPRHRRGAASGMKTLMEVAGAVLITSVVGIFMGRYDATGQFLWIWAASGLLGAMALAGTAATSLLVARAPLNREEAVERGPAPVSTAPHPDYKWFLLSRLFIAIGAASLQTFALFYLEDVVGIANPAEELWKLALVIGGALALAAYPAGALADRVGRKPVLLAAGVLGGLAPVLLLTSGSLAGVLAVGGLAGVAGGTYLGASWAMASDMVSSRRTAQQLGYVNLATALGAGLARLNGLWVDALNARSEDLGYSVLMVLCGILFVAGAALVLHVRAEARSQPAAALAPSDRPA